RQRVELMRSGFGHGFRLRGDGALQSATALRRIVAESEGPCGSRDAVDSTTRTRREVEFPSHSGGTQCNAKRMPAGRVPSRKAAERCRCKAGRWKKPLSRLPHASATARAPI